jgi:hypothetical protein
MSTWFNDIGWWCQEEAYNIFDIYRKQQNKANLDAAIEAALPIIRVVYSTQKIKLDSVCDMDDLVSAAALTICKALPKMACKTEEQIGTHKQYMRYLFTCVQNAFYRELNIIQKKPARIKKRIFSESSAASEQSRSDTLRSVELQILITSLPQHLHYRSLEAVRFKDKDLKVCSYILQQLVCGREVSGSILQTLGCTNKDFFIEYCRVVLFDTFCKVKEEIAREDFVYTCSESSTMGDSTVSIDTTK